MSDSTPTQKNVIEPPYYSNWADLFFPSIANKLLPFVSRFKWITPNIVTLVFFIYAVVCDFVSAFISLGDQAADLLLYVSDNRVQTTARRRLRTG